METLGEVCAMHRLTFLIGREPPQLVLRRGKPGLVSFGGIFYIGQRD
jgi:hypothetical protein